MHEMERVVEQEDTPTGRPVSELAGSSPAPLTTYSERQIMAGRRAIAKQFRQTIDQVMDWEAIAYLKKIGTAAEQ
jgi:hypothetical protein